MRAVTSPRAPGRTHELWWSADLATQAWQRHLLQVGYTDKLLGRLIDRLKAVGLWNKALVVVDPDHGISFHGGDKRREPTKTNLSDLAFIPLFMKLPGERHGRVVDTHVTTEDILPTIADVLGIDVPWETTGVSMLSGAPEPSVRCTSARSRLRTRPCSRNASAACDSSSRCSVPARGARSSRARAGSAGSSGSPCRR